ncbi:hypothetical protein HYY75_00260 [bacterium]|nr:hypothetical protein [bacterium]
MTNKSVMYFSITKPNIVAQPVLGVSAQTGEWSGVVLGCNNRKLTLIRTGNVTTYNTSFAPSAGLVPGAPFASWVVPGSNPAKDTISTQMDDTETILVQNTTSTDNKVKIQVTVQFCRYQNGVATNAKITESILAKMLVLNHPVNPFGP